MYSCAKLLRRSERSRNNGEDREIVYSEMRLSKKKNKDRLSYFGNAQVYSVETDRDEDCPTGKLYISTK